MLADLRSIFGNRSEVSPTTIADLQSIVHEAKEKGHALYPVGGGTQLSLGYLPSQPGRIVHLKNLNAVIDYPARDMTVTVQAGIAIARLQEILRAEGQWLPIDIPLPDQATLGGSIAVNASGHRRYGLGTLRDYVIGISVVNDEGEEIKGGGRVVKNVAGYDLMKLYTGSLGTLGIISQVTLKLKPLPESNALLLIPVDATKIADTLDRLHATRTRPVCIELLSPSACSAIEQSQSLNLRLSEKSRWCIVVGFEDNRQAVVWQIEQLRKELTAEVLECNEQTREQLTAILRDFSLQQEATLSFKANMLPSAVAGFCTQAADNSSSLLLQAHAGNGIVEGHVSEVALDPARSLIERLSLASTHARGNLIVTRCPLEWKSVLPVWGQPTGDRVVMKAVKAKLDPNHIFNPGRFVDGI